MCLDDENFTFLGESFAPFFIPGPSSFEIHGGLASRDLQAIICLANKQVNLPQNLFRVFFVPGGCSESFVYQLFWDINWK